MKLSARRSLLILLLAPLCLGASGEEGLNAAQSLLF